jgi:hypothetical protein
LRELSDLWEEEGVVMQGFRNMYNPHIIQEPGDEYPFKMWFFGWAAEDCNPGYPGCDAIFYARGKDLHHWEVYAGEERWDEKMDPHTWAPVVTPRDRFYDEWHDGDPSVVLHDGKYYMAYTATGWNRDGKPMDDRWHLSCIMGAVSGDGILWERSDEPILIWEPEIGKPNYADFPGPGTYFGGYARPSIMYDNDNWRLWFDCGLECSMAYAENSGEFLDPDGWELIRGGDDPLIQSWPNLDVIKVGDRYYCYSDPDLKRHGVEDWSGVGWEARQICEAVSPDGLNWEVLG